MFLILTWLSRELNDNVTVKCSVCLYLVQAFAFPTAFMPIAPVLDMLIIRGILLGAWVFTNSPSHFSFPWSESLNSVLLKDRFAEQQGLPTSWLATSQTINLSLLQHLLKSWAHRLRTCNHKFRVQLQ